MILVASNSSIRFRQNDAFTAWLNGGGSAGDVVQKWVWGTGTMWVLSFLDKALTKETSDVNIQ